MDKYSTIIKISLKMFKKLPDELTQEEKNIVIDIYDDYY
tara:strand:- start:331 stop:447 length:117 start_codon:yes stop_codon:yes gene_type:complete